LINGIKIKVMRLTILFV